MPIFQNIYLRAFLRGAALPGMIVMACAAVGVLMDVFSFSPLSGTISGVKAGIALGLFASFVGVFEIIALFFVANNIAIRLRLTQALGYASVWVACIYIILKLSGG